MPNMGGGVLVIDSSILLDGAEQRGLGKVALPPAGLHVDLLPRSTHQTASFGMFVRIDVRARDQLLQHVAGRDQQSAVDQALSILPVHDRSIAAEADRSVGQDLHGLELTVAPQKAE